MDLDALVSGGVGFNLRKLPTLFDSNGDFLNLFGHVCSFACKVQIFKLQCLLNRKIQGKLFFLVC